MAQTIDAQRVSLVALAFTLALQLVALEQRTQALDEFGPLSLNAARSPARAPLSRAAAGPVEARGGGGGAGGAARGAGGCSVASTTLACAAVACTPRERETAALSGTSSRRLDENRWPLGSNMPDDLWVEFILYYIFLSSINVMI